MDDKLRERICRALKIQLAADDAVLGAAVDEAVAGNNDLTTVLEALGVPLTGDALKVIPQLRAAEQKIQGVLQELRDLLTQEQAADAAVGQGDIGAAAKAAGLTGEGATRALGAYRAHLIDEEVRKLGDAAKVDGELKLSKLRDARRLGREKFLTEYGVKDLSLSHLATPTVSGPGGTQLAPPKPGGTVLPIDQSADDGEPKVVDLRGTPGPNPTIRFVTHLRATDPAFAKLAYSKQIQKASELRKTVTLQLE